MNVSVPGDKSITQRALLMAALAPGRSRLSGLLASADPRSTAGALRALGADIPSLPDEGTPIEVVGRGLRGLVPPTAELDLGNSGTGARLLMGVLAGQPLSATVTGDPSLRARPMGRITGPLSRMGARFEEMGDPGRLPIRVHGGVLRPFEYDLPVASAQVKSSLLFAGLVSGAFVLLTEPGTSRDHTERIFEAAGVPVVRHARGRGWRVELRDPPSEIAPLDLAVPGDLSSAAFLIVLAVLGGGGGELILRDVGLNPTRRGALSILDRMGASVRVEEAADTGTGEPVGTIVARPSALRATTVGAADVPTAIDEIPALVVAAARAEGVTRVTGAEELRVKETDRISALAENLRAVGVAVEELDDGLEVEGGEHPLRGRVRAFDDHRIAMAFGVLGALPGNDIEVDHPDVVDVSYPGFWKDLRAIVARR